MQFFLEKRNDWIFWDWSKCWQMTNSVKHEKTFPRRFMHPISRRLKKVSRPGNPPNNELMVAEYGNKIVGIFADHLHSLFGPQEGLAAFESLSDYRPLQIEGVSVKMRVREQ